MPGYPSFLFYGVRRKSSTNPDYFEQGPTQEHKQMDDLHKMVIPTTTTVDIQSTANKLMEMDTLAMTQATVTHPTVLDIPERHQINK